MAPASTSQRITEPIEGNDNDYVSFEEAVTNDKPCNPTKKRFFSLPFWNRQSQQKTSSPKILDDDHEDGRDELLDKRRDMASCDEMSPRSMLSRKARRFRILLVMLSLIFLMALVVLRWDILVSSVRSIGGHRHFNDNYFVGSQAIFSSSWDAYRVYPYSEYDYTEDDYDMLTELREAIASSGMNQFKFKLSSTTCASYRLNCMYDEDEGGDDYVASLLDLAQTPEVANTLSDKRFLWYHIWIYSFNLPKPLKQDISEEALAAEYQETYELAVHLLKTYKGTGKTFLLGNWEGDWEMLWASSCKSQSSKGYNDCYPSDEVVERFMAWANVRQKAIDHARASVRARNVHVFYYIEFNLGEENFEESRPTILNSVAPVVNPDFLSYSAYKSTNRYINHGGQWFNQTGADGRFHSVLDYAQSKLSPKSMTDFSVVLGGSADGNKRVYVGEFGPNGNVDATLARTTVADIVRASLEWGCPFVLQWEVYDNNSTTALIPRDTEDLYSEFTPLRLLYVEWNAAATTFVADNNPTLDEFRAFAIEWFAMMEEAEQ